jgi:large subunit ribosomal protein L21
MKYAIVEDGSKQYKVAEGATIDVDYFSAESGDQFDLSQVLLIRDGEQIIIGTPLIEGARVQATVLDQVKGPKLIVFRYKPKKRIRTKTGHRQKYTRLQIDAIVMNGEG